MSTTNTWLQNFGSQHSIVESRFPSPLDCERKATVLLDRVCVHVHECADGKRFLCARPAEGGAWCDEHKARDSPPEAWRGPNSLPPFPLERNNVVAYIDGLWVDVNTLKRADTNEDVDFVDDILIW